MKKRTNKLSEDLIKAVVREDITFVREHINIEDVNNLDSYGRSLIFYSIINNNHAVTIYLLKLNPDLNIKDKKGWALLHYSAQNKSIEMADLLIKEGAYIDIKDDYGNTPLWRAVFSSDGNGTMIEFLLKVGADPNLPNNSGISPLKLAYTIANFNVRQFFSAE